ncbi:Uncharacterized protein OBRU01_25553 [Operophtera brumata]|uniref:RING-type E3 ubiquitin transferase n=1 Tax=Operophtera brumata TaxID=104452 RepID=A0A0L7K5C2_OPEBR|nr:Uncharacterized protein OBRU01_25553 [Operophtera brumata]
MDFFSDIAGETFVLGVDTLIIGFCLRQLGKCKHILNTLQTAPVLDIDASLHDEIKKYSNETVPYVVIRGLVKPLGSPIEHVIARTSAGFWSDQTRTIHEVCNSTPFELTNGKYSIEVIDALAAELLDHVWGFFSGVRQRGLQTMEEMLRDGSYITAIGELSRSNTGALKIQPPRDLPLYLTTATKTSLLKRLTMVFGTLAAAASCRVAYKWVKRRKRRALEDSLKKQLAAGRRERRVRARDKDLTEVQLCVVCAENPKEVTYKWVKRRALEDSLKKQLAAGRRERRVSARDKDLTEVQLSFDVGKSTLPNKTSDVRKKKLTVVLFQR